MRGSFSGGFPDKVPALLMGLATTHIPNIYRPLNTSGAKPPSSLNVWRPSGSEDDLGESRALPCGGASFFVLGEAGQKVVLLSPPPIVFGYLQPNALEMCSLQKVIFQCFHQHQSHAMIPSTGVVDQGDLAVPPWGTHSTLPLFFRGTAEQRAGIFQCSSSLTILILRTKPDSLVRRDSIMFTTRPSKLYKYRICSRVVRCRASWTRRRSSARWS